MEGVLNWCQHNVNVGQQKRWVTLQLKCIDNDSTNITTFLAGLPSADLAMGTDTKNGKLLTSVHRIVGNMSFLINVGYPSNSDVYRDKRQHTAQDFLWREVARLSKCMAILTVQRTQEFDFETKLEIVAVAWIESWTIIACRSYWETVDILAYEMTLSAHFWCSCPLAVKPLCVVTILSPQKGKRPTCRGKKERKMENRHTCQPMTGWTRW